jgi:hypothetical protein
VKAASAEDEVNDAVVVVDVDADADADVDAVTAAPVSGSLPPSSDVL